MSTLTGTITAEAVSGVAEFTPAAPGVQQAEGRRQEQEAKTFSICHFPFDGLTGRFVCRLASHPRRIITGSLEGNGK